MNSGQHTDTDTDTIKSLLTRVEMLEEVNRAMEDEQRRIRRNAMYLENVVASIWRATMGPIPDPTPQPRPKPPMERPPVAPATELVSTPQSEAKRPPTGKNKASEAITSIRGRFGG